MGTEAVRVNELKTDVLPKDGGPLVLVGLETRS